MLNTVAFCLRVKVLGYLGVREVWVGIGFINRFSGDFFLFGFG